jgi:ubiquinone/menaquinone biosynthesis C-methylase UbiE
MKSWDGVGEAYAASYASLCAGTIAPLLAKFGPAEGRRALDVGSGTGELAARFRDAGWDAVGCEPEATMRAVAGHKHPGIRFVDAGFPSLPCASGSFDAVTANFVLNHVKDPRRSASEMARVAATGAVLGATIWVLSPSWFWRDVCESAGLQPAAGERLPPEKDFERTSAGFATMLEDAGWREVVTEDMSWTWEVSPTALWASAEGGVASAGLFYQGLDSAERARFRSAFDRVCARHAIDDVIPLAHTAAVAVGRAL